MCLTSNRKTLTMADVADAAAKRAARLATLAWKLDNPDAYTAPTSVGAEAYAHSLDMQKAANQAAILQWKQRNPHESYTPQHLVRRGGKLSSRK